MKRKYILKIICIILLMLLFSISISAKERFNSTKTESTQKGYIPYGYTLDYGNYEWTFFPWGVWPGDYDSPTYPQDYDVNSMLFSGKTFISNSEYYHYYGEFCYEVEGACCFGQMIPAQELSYLDSISQKDVIAGWSCGPADATSLCGGQGLTVGCTWRSLQWNIDQLDDVIPTVWTIFNYSDTYESNEFYITLEMDWDIPDTDYENNAVQYYDEFWGSRTYNVTTDLSGGIIFLSTGPKNMKVTSWDDPIWNSGDTTDHTWFWTNIVISDEFSTRSNPDDYRTYYTIGPISLAPGEKYEFIWAFVFGHNETEWLDNVQVLLESIYGWPCLSYPPPGPDIELTTKNNTVKLRWTRNRKELPFYEYDISSEAYKDNCSLVRLWDGYRIYRNLSGTGEIDEGTWSFIAELNSTYVYNTWGTIPEYDLNPLFWENTYWAEFIDKDPELYTGFKYYYTVIAYDGKGNQSSPSENVKSIVLKGRHVNEDIPVKIIPNPYKNFRVPGFDEGVVFTDLPPKCTIKIFTSDGRLIIEIDHNNGTPDERWNLKNTHGKKIASGIYLYVIESDLGTQKGKLAIIK